MRPLEGITIVALEQVIAGPFATRQLAELGARVIKIERPEGGDSARAYDRTVNGLSSHFVWVNRSKESLALDVKHPAAKDVLARLMAKADVFLHNLAPGAVDRLGLGAAELRARHPALIWCGISGYGPAGPYASKKAYDLLVQCEAGLLSVTGTPESPAKAGIPAADIAAGMYAFSSVLAALVRRGRSGEGRDHRRDDARGPRRMDGLPRVLHGVRRQRAAAVGRRTTPRSFPTGRSAPATGKPCSSACRTSASSPRSAMACSGRAPLKTDPRFASSPARFRNRESMHREIEQVFSALTAARDRSSGWRLPTSRTRG